LFEIVDFVEFSGGSTQGGGTVLAPERQHRILRELEVREAVRVVELAETLRVSEMTVRRDIEALDSRSLLRRIHGGATRLEKFSALEPGFDSNADKELDAKTAIAGAALALVQPGMTVSLSGGTTTYQLAHLLGTVSKLTVVTNSLKAAEAIQTQINSGSTDAKVIITGGERTPSEALVGPVATAAIRRLHVDLCFMGVHGIHPGHGLSTPNLIEAETNLALIESADQLAVLADHTKFNVVSLAGIAPLEAVRTLITDQRLPPGSARLYRQLVHDLVLAPERPHRTTGHNSEGSAV
jgi:DeoR/GlpR family transcriptional regulator of sugar metabolism